MYWNLQLEMLCGNCIHFSKPRELSAHYSRLYWVYIIPQYTCLKKKQTLGRTTCVKPWPPGWQWWGVLSHDNSLHALNIYSVQNTGLHMNYIVYCEKLTESLSIQLEIAYEIELNWENILSYKCVKHKEQYVQRSGNCRDHWSIRHASCPLRTQCPGGSVR